MGKTCQICGKPSGFYPLCTEHMKLKTEGKVIKCEQCQKWHLIDSPCDCDKNIKENTQDGNKCIICESESKDKTLCLNCYKDILTKKNEILSESQTPWELKDFYYNLQNSIWRLKTFEIVKAQAKKMFAISWIVRDVYHDKALSNRVEEDVAKLIKSKEVLKENKQNLTNEKKDKTIVATANLDKNRSSDGHICKSQQEVKIDDILFKFNICHAYGRKVKEIPSKEERTLTADWFIPLQGSKGIYIEYWGMDSADYEDNKEEKLKLYEKYKDKVKLIFIEKEDVNDIQTLEDNLYQQLKEFGWND